VTFAFLGDEIYIKAGAEIPSRRHYGNYPQIEDGVGMVRSFVNAFEAAVRTGSGSDRVPANVRTHAAAIIPSGIGIATKNPVAIAPGSDMFGTLLTGEMFAPILREQIDKYNELNGTRLTVVAVPNTYFGGDVSVAGLLTGKDFLAVRDKIVGDFVTIPKITIKSDEPIFLDGMSYSDLERQFPVPISPFETEGLIDLLKQKMAGI
jgi:NifB/MoaA-like Fe-S oxidoreductase